MSRGSACELPGGAGEQERNGGGEGFNERWISTIDHTPVEGWSPPTAGRRLQIIRSSKVVALVGVSGKPERPSNFVATYLISSAAHFQVYFVNPMESEILGRPSYPSLAELPERPEIVDVFRAPEHCPTVAREAVDVGADTLWLQLGIWSPEAARIGVDHGLNVVMDRCLKVEHARFHGGLHLAGFDTGVISSRRYEP